VLFRSHLSSRGNESDSTLEFHTPPQWLTVLSRAERKRERRKRLSERQRIAPDQTDTVPHNRDANKDHSKRCHIVIHNLHKKVKVDDISRVVNELTGSSPLILSQLICNIRDRVAFRVTCPFEHLHLLKGENFGFNVKVSRYHISRDFPAGHLKHPMGGDRERPPTSTPNPPTTPPPRELPSVASASNQPTQTYLNKSI